MSILAKEEVLELRQSQGIVPDEEDDTVEIWKRSGVLADGQSNGGAGVDEAGYPVTTSSILDNDPTNDTPGFTHYKTLFGRVESASIGKENDFGAQNTSVAPWDIVLPAIDLDTLEEIEISPGDELRVLQPSGSFKVFQAVSADDGETYGILLTVRCQRIEQ